MTAPNPYWIELSKMKFKSNKQPIYLLLHLIPKHKYFMKKIIFILALISLLGCEKVEQSNRQFENGTYIGTFQRSNNNTANITIIIDSNNWSGISNLEKYPALCNGTYSIIGDSILFTNDCVWTTEFDWSLILKGKYEFKEDGNTIEISKKYYSEGDVTDIDKYIITRQ